MMPRPSASVPPVCWAMTRWNTRLQAVYAALRSWMRELRRANAVSTQPAFDLLRTQFQSLAEAWIRHRKPQRRAGSCT